MASFDLSQKSGVRIAGATSSQVLQQNFPKSIPQAAMPGRGLDIPARAPIQLYSAAACGRRDLWRDLLLAQVRLIGNGSCPLKDKSWRN